MSICKALNCNVEIETCISNLINIFNIKCCVLTGTDDGSTTIFLDQLDTRVHEQNKDFYIHSKTRVRIYNDNSINFLQSILPGLRKDYKYILCYAHWWDPLNDEIKELGKYYKDNLIIIIEVPNRALFQSNNKIDSIKQSLITIGEYIYYYSSKTEDRGLTIGKLYIISKALANNKGINLKDLYTTEHGENYSMLNTLNCDSYLEKHVSNLVHIFNIKCYISTGGTYATRTCEGGVTFLDQLDTRVRTFEQNKEFYIHSKTRVRIYNDNSINFLQSILPGLRKDYKYILCYAHWWDQGCPLNDEIKELGKYYKDNLIIIIEVLNRALFQSNNKIDSIKQSLSTIGEYIYYYSSKTEESSRYFGPGTNIGLLHIGVGRLYIISKELAKNKGINIKDLYTTEQGENYAKDI